MRRLVVACSLTAFTFRAVAAQEAAVAPQAPLRAQLTDEVIRDAVKHTLAETGTEQRILNRKVLSGDQYKKFERKFSEAQVPSCIHPDALRLQPAEIETKNWVIGLGGILVVPFIVVAAARGKCH
jgi:predicted secreted protein